MEKKFKKSNSARGGGGGGGMTLRATSRGT